MRDLSYEIGESITRVTKSIDRLNEMENLSTAEWAAANETWPWVCITRLCALGWFSYQAVLQLQRCINAK